jgi:hypothetical protein
MPDTDPQPDPTPDPPPDPKPDPKPPERDLAAELKVAQAALESERKQHEKAQRALAQAKQAQMSEAEKAIAAARDEGRAEASRAAGRRLAAAEFRALASGRLADPAALLEDINLDRFVGDDGEPDQDAISHAVERLVAAAAAPANGKKPAPPSVPGGVRETAEEADWLRAQLKG